jgi:hypothetical protein
VPLNPRQERAGANPAGSRSAEFMVWLHSGIDKMKKLVGPHNITLPKQVS